MNTASQFSLRWNNYVNHVRDAFNIFRLENDLVDVTLCCEDGKINAHKMLLSACSNYFKQIFKENPCQHPVIIFRNVKFEDLNAIINFMYHGEINIFQEQLESFLITAELLKVKGLTDNVEEENSWIQSNFTENVSLDLSAKTKLSQKPVFNVPSSVSSDEPINLAPEQSFREENNASVNLSQTNSNNELEDSTDLNTDSTKNESTVIQNFPEDMHIDNQIQVIGDLTEKNSNGN